MDVIKKNPFILITIITIAAALFGVGKQIIDSPLLSLPASSVTTHSENLQQMQDMQSELAGGRGHGIYKNYELNLVFKDGTRLNLLNHGGEAEFEQQTEKLSKVLGIPVWEA